MGSMGGDNKRIKQAKMPIYIYREASGFDGNKERLRTDETT